MSEWLMILNAAAVGIFGAILSAAFSKVPWTQRTKLLYGGVMVALGVVQMSLYAIFDVQTLRFWYPLITHLPLVLVLSILSHKWLWSLVSVLTAYLCCQLRRWIALFCVAIFAGGDELQAILELVVTLPLLLALIKFAAPAVREVSSPSAAMRLQFSIIPAVSYVFDYLTRIYTNWLVLGIPAAVEFMPFVCAAAYLFFALYSAKTMRRQSELEQTQAVLDLQLKQSAQRLADMRRSQELAAEYRHDLRHHLQYLSSCLEQGALSQAQDYIQSLQGQLSGQIFPRYSANTEVDLILSAFAARAKEHGVEISVRIPLVRQLRVSENDLCVLLSNALENALHACIRAKAEGSPASIHILGHTKKNQLLLEISNTCTGQVRFENDLPVTAEKGHGIGVRSICAVVEKYNGLYSFEAAEGRFILRLQL